MLYNRYQVVGKQSNDYRNSSPWLDFIDPAHPTVVAGHAERTGITGPGYPERAVYKLVLPGGKEVAGLFIFENGEFVPRDEWYRAQVDEQKEYASQYEVEWVDGNWGVK